MAKRIVIDPITRIEGHLKIECTIDNGTITDAWSTGTLWRGIESILKGRDARDAWMISQRICGVCTVSHAIGAVRATEHALDMKIPMNAQYIRSMMIGAHSIVDNVIHFYILSLLDWFDIKSAAFDADPQKAADLAASQSAWKNNSYATMKETQDKLKKLIESKQLGVFSDGYSGHPEMTLPPEVNLIFATHYFESLHYQRKANKIVTILGSKTPHVQNLAIGGVANPINPNSQAVLTLERLEHIKTLIDELEEFMKEVYNYDVALLASYYPKWSEIGKGQGNYLSYPEMPMTEDSSSCMIPGGYIEGYDFSTFRKIDSQRDKFIEDNIKESIKHSYFKGDWLRHPYVQNNHKLVSGYDENNRDKYSWVKAPYFKEKTAEPGPTADVYAMYFSKYEPALEIIDRVFDKIELISGTRYTLEKLDSTVGRFVAKSIRATVMQDGIKKQWQALVKNIKQGNYETVNKPVFTDQETSGMGVHSAPRGAMVHWTTLKDGKIEGYASTIPTTWLAAPRAHNGELGAYEGALIGLKVIDEKRPLEIVRVIHSYDPCMACACHMLDPNGKEFSEVKIFG